MMTMLRLLPMGLFGAFLGAIAERMERRTALILVVVSMVVNVACAGGAGAPAPARGVASRGRQLHQRHRLGDRQSGAARDDRRGGRARRRWAPPCRSMSAPTTPAAWWGRRSAACCSPASASTACSRSASCSTRSRWWRRCRVRYRNSFPPNASESVLARIAEGLALVRNDRRLIGTLTITVIYNVFGWPFTSMVPVIGQDQPDARTRRASASSPAWTASARSPARC